MDKETKEFIESQNKALMEDVVGVIRDMGTAFEARMERMETGLREEIGEVRAEMGSMETRLKDQIGAVALEVLEVKQLVKRIDDRTQHQVEALYEEVRVTQKAVVKIEKHIGLPESSFQLVASN
jgi:hypothetical protein